MVLDEIVALIASLPEDQKPKLLMLIKEKVGRLCPHCDGFEKPGDRPCQCSNDE